MRAVLSAALIVPLIIVSPAPATTWKSMDDDQLVHCADMIVRGKITAVDGKDGRYPGMELGVIEVAEVVYGPPDLAKVRLVLDARDHGLVYRPGDAGTWFLRVRPPGAAQAQEIQGWRPPALAVAPDAVFSASHPCTFWPEPHAPRHGVKELAMTPQEWQQRRERLLRRVEDRLKKDAAALEKALDAAKQNLDRIRRSAGGPSEADRSREREKLTRRPDASPADVVTT